MGGFHDICGHRKTIEQLKSFLRTGMVSQAYLISGEAGMGKKTLAAAFAQALQCENRTDTMDACGECKSCIQAMSGNHPDIITWSHVKPKTFAVEEAKALAEDTQIRPFSASHKIYIVPDAEMMTVQAQNALLKTLEEPPGYVVIILLTTSLDAMLETIRSRCVMLDLKPVEDETVRRYVLEHSTLSGQEADLVMAFAQGNIGRAMSLAGSEDFRNSMDLALKILTRIKEMDVPTVCALVKELTDYKQKIEEILDLFSVWYRDILFFKATKDIDGIIFKEQAMMIRERARESSYEGVQYILEAIGKAEARLQANVGFELTMELLLLTMHEN